MAGMGMGATTTPRDIDRALRVLVGLTDPEAVKAEAERLKKMLDEANERINEAKAVEESASKRIEALNDAAAKNDASSLALDDRRAELTRQKQQLEAQRLAVNADNAANTKRDADLNTREAELVTKQQAFDAANEIVEQRIKDQEDALAKRAASLDEREDNLAKAEAAYDEKRKQLNKALAGV